MQGNKNRLLYISRLPFSRTLSLIALALATPFNSANAVPDEELIKRAESGESSAQIALGEQYLADSQLKQSHYWYIKALQQGDPDALTHLGDLFESQNRQALNPLLWAENWYQLGNELAIPEAEEGYARVLETLFNQRRAKQVTAITLMDEQIDQDIATSPTSLPPPSAESNQVRDLSLALIGIIILISGFISVRRIFRQRQTQKKEQSQAQINQQSKKIASLQRHLHKTQELLSLSQQQQQQTKQDQSLAIACAIMGFQPNRLPNTQKLKARYKKLSKIYHPDAGGSEDDMKRLNIALRLIATHQKT